MSGGATEALLAGLLETRVADFTPPPLDPAALAGLGARAAPGTPHRRLLERANGAFLFGGALHLLGACTAPGWHSLAVWNDAATWRAVYGDLAAGLVFFAEDAFGDQFAYRDHGGEVVAFQAELGRQTVAASSFLAWVEGLLDHPTELLPIEVLAKQASDGHPLVPGTQLLAWPPLCSVEAEAGIELGHVDAIEAMRFRGALARRLRDLPSGAPLKVEIGD